MGRRLSAALLAACLWTAAGADTSVIAVVAAVRSAIHKGHKDRDVAASLQKMKLAECLEDRIIETLESEGAGPQTLGVLQQMRDESRSLPLPPSLPPGLQDAPPPSLAEQHRIWEAARANSLAYTGSLPDFICSETIHRWQDPEGKAAWRPLPTVVAELTFFDRKEQYRLITIDKQPTTKSLTEVGGAMSQGEFGSLLRKIFAPSSQATFGWDHWTTLRKRPTHVYSFAISPDHAPYFLQFGVARPDELSTVAGQHGYVYIDRESLRVMRISQQADSIPRDFPLQKAGSVLDYDFAEIGGRLFLLPLRAEVRLDAGKLQNLNEVEFHGYHKFSSNATVSFGTEAPVKK